MCGSNLGVIDRIRKTRTRRRAHAFIRFSQKRKEKEYEHSVALVDQALRQRKQSCNILAKIDLGQE